jgi:hypothetical protein
LKKILAEEGGKIEGIDLKESLDKFGSVKFLQVINSLAHANITDGYL